MPLVSHRSPGHSVVFFDKIRFSGILKAEPGWRAGIITFLLRSSSGCTQSASADLNHFYFFPVVSTW